MTLVLAAIGRESIWLLADRRISYRGKAPVEDGQKLMFLDTSDGTAILGYAGLGATALGTEPANWMSAVLRGRKLQLEESLAVLADALKNQFPPHLRRLQGPDPASHNVLVPAILNGLPRLYSIDLQYSAEKRKYLFRFTRHVTGPIGAQRTPRTALAGSGLWQLHGKGTWNRELIRLLRAYDEKKISDAAVADHLAALNLKVHKGVSDGSVGPRCIVAWRNRKAGIHAGGGGQRYYNGTELERHAPSLPSIANGMDVKAVIGTLWPLAMSELSKTGPVDIEAMNAALAQLPRLPDEKLR